MWVTADPSRHSLGFLRVCPEERGNAEFHLCIGRGTFYLCAFVLDRGTMISSADHSRCPMESE